MVTTLVGLGLSAYSYGGTDAPSSKPPSPSSSPADVTVAITGPTVAMWAWNWTDSAAMVSFAQANGVTEILAYVAPGFTDPTYVPWGWSQPQLPLEESLSADAAAAGITVYAMGEPAPARSVGIPLRFAAEDNQDSPSWLSFYGDTLSEFDASLSQVKSDMAGTSGYVGIAVEDYQGWSAMP
jgi:hypothetical protein